MFQIVFYVPTSHLEPVKQALFDSGAGKYDLYDSCSWECKGTGQFRPLPNSKPYLGCINALQNVEEWKVEMLCQEQYLQSAVHALIQAHPYETPAYSVYPVFTIDSLPVPGLSNEVGDMHKV